MNIREFSMSTLCETTDLLVFSHLRWDFVFQRPQHLLSRHAKHRRVFYFEEPVWGMTELPRLHLKETPENVLVIIPHLPSSITTSQMDSTLAELVDELIYEEELIDYTTWYYNPAAIGFSRHLEPKNVIFDCIDAFSLVQGTPQSIIDLEAELLARADLVFTGGNSLFEAKKKLHHNIHSFPGSIDYSHFSQARQKLVEPDDQINIPHPRIGFYGVIDERFDFELLKEIAQLCTDHQFVLVGPVIKIDPLALSRKSNIHYLDKKDYHTLPLYLAGWDCAMIPFVLNESTKFISPTKTAEFLAGGKPVVTTSILDVVFTYGKKNLVQIADTVEDFINAFDVAVEESKKPEWLDRVDHYLKNNSWDLTFSKMAELEMKLSSSRNDLKRSKIRKHELFNSTGVIYP